jgi:hypothetical protein
MTPITLWPTIYRVANTICTRELRFSKVRILPATKWDTKYFGKCMRNRSGPATIVIRVHRLNQPNRPLSQREILDTLAHELAHIKYWHHNKEHQQYKNYLLRMIYELIDTPPGGSNYQSRSIHRRGRRRCRNIKRGLAK